MPGGLIRGSLLLAGANKKKSPVVAQANGRNITAKAALSAIKRKYGSVDREKSYYHRGNNEWAEYSKARDASHALKKPRQVAPSSSTKFKNRQQHCGDTKGNRFKRGRL